MADRVGDIVLAFAAGWIAKPYWLVARSIFVNAWKAHANQKASKERADG